MLLFVWISPTFFQTKNWANFTHFFWQAKNWSEEFLGGSTGGSWSRFNSVAMTSAGWLFTITYFFLFKNCETFHNNLQISWVTIRQSSHVLPHVYHTMFLLLRTNRFPVTPAARLSIAVLFQSDRWPGKFQYCEMISNLRKFQLWNDIKLKPKDEKFSIVKWYQT